MIRWTLAPSYSRYGHSVLNYTPSHGTPRCNPTYVTKKEGTALVDTIFLVSDIYFLGFLLCFTKLSRSLYTPGKRCIGSDHLGLLFLDRRGKWGRAYMGGISERAFLGHGVDLDSVKHSWRKWGKALGLICSIQYRGGREG